MPNYMYIAGAILKSVLSFCLKKLSAAYIQVHFGLDFIMELNTVNTDEALLGAV